jgi:nickel/cobalt exporter
MELLILSSLSIGILHAMAPDHWLPFVMLGKAQQWSKWKTTKIVSLAGLGHVGIQCDHYGDRTDGRCGVGTCERMGGTAGEYRIAAADLFRCGIYCVGDQELRETYSRTFASNHEHPHGENKAKIVSYWTLFALIIFGPCEPLIPLLFASIPYGWFAITAIFTVFGIVTIGMMLLQVHLAMLGLSFMRTHFFEDASHVIAGV